MISRRAEDLVEVIAAGPGRRERLSHLEILPARTARHADWPDWAHPIVVTAFQNQGVDRPWSHQRTAADQIASGHHTVLATGTASGKSLAYLLPTLSRITSSRGPQGQRGSSALYLAPTKALAHDQYAAIGRLGIPGLRVSTHDGDSGTEQRAWTRDHAEYVLTNPDMLHRSLLPGHERWASFFSTLDVVVLDEAHHYRGLFGAHVSLILRRLRRIAARYGSDPTFVIASATVADPDAVGERLTGHQVASVTDDGSPRGRVALALWEPGFLAGEDPTRTVTTADSGALRAGENGAPVRRSATAELGDLLADLVAADVRTLAFVRSRRAAETVALNARRLLAEVDEELAPRVGSYRGGYLPEERRALEQALRAGGLRGLAATNALELGIDIAGLDAVLIGGFPGTRAALWQQIGRAGRGGEDALGVLVARDDPLDTYLVAHPEHLIGRPVEASVFDPENPYVLGPQLCAAAAEIPLTEADLPLFGPTAAEALDALTRAGLLRRRPRGWFWTDRQRASDLADIRSAGGSPVRLVENSTGRMLGTVDAAAAHGSAHAGAVYLHLGESYLVTELDLDESVAFVTATDVDYSTSARELTDIAILSERRHQQWGRARLSFGHVRVTHQVVSFLRRRVPSGEVLGEHPLDLPERTLDTAAVWWTLPDDALETFDPLDLPGAAHAAEHAAIGLLPLVATCDRWDIGGVSTALHPDTGQLTVFVYDGHPGGAGFAERGYAMALEWWGATRDAIAACACVEGCPSCVQSPKCGNQNNPLDKAGAIALLDILLGEAAPS